MIDIIIHSLKKSEIDAALTFLCDQLTIPYKYNKRKRTIELKNGLLHPILIEGKFGSADGMAGSRPDFYICSGEHAEIILVQAAFEVNGVELTDISDILKIIDILKMEVGHD